MKERSQPSVGIQYAVPELAMIREGLSNRVADRPLPIRVHDPVEVLSATPIVSQHAHANGIVKAYHLWYERSSKMDPLPIRVYKGGSSLFGVGKAFEYTPWENRLFGYSPSCEEPII